MNQTNNSALNSNSIFNVSKRSSPGRRISQSPSKVGSLPSIKWAVVLAIASVIAIGISGYLSYVGLTSSKIAGCGSGDLFDCSHVTTSRWSLWLGIPVSLLAVGLYLGMIGSLFVGASERFSKQVRRVGWAAVSVLAIAAGLSAIWFIGLQIFVLNHLCTYCLAAHACGLVAAFVVLSQRPIGTFSLKTISSLSVAGFAVLVGGQLMTEPPQSFEIVPFEAPVASEEDASEFEAPMASEDEAVEFEAPVAPTAEPSTSKVTVRLPSVFQLKQAIATAVLPAAALSFQVGELSDQKNNQQQSAESANQTLSEEQAENETQAATQKEQVAEPRMVKINGGTIKLDIAKWPVAGSLSAKHVFVEMFDYSCPNCRRTHAAIKSAKEKLSGELAVVVLPVPLNAACNGTIQATKPDFAESCEMSKLAVAVWQVDAAKFTKFHNWMFASEKAPTYQQAKAHAEKLVDPAKLGKVIESEMPGQYIKKTVELYQRVGAGTVPKLIFPSTSVVGEFTSADSLVDLIKQQSEE